MNYNRNVLKYGKIVEASSKVIGNITPHIKIDRVVRVLPANKLKDYGWDIYLLEAKGIPFWRIADIFNMSESYARKLWRDNIPIWRP